MEGVSRRSEIAGIDMRWLEAGDPTAAPVVLLHGNPTSPELWRRVIPLLHRRRVLAWELVGYGDSIPAGRERPISVAAQADYLLAWMDALEIPRALLAGHDLGGGVAQVVATRRPGRCTGVVLTNCVAFDAWPVWPMRLLRTGGPLLRWLPDPLWRPPFLAIVGGMHRERRIGRESAAIHWSHYAAHGVAGSLVRQVRSQDDADTMRVAEKLRELDLPARVVWGDADRFLPLSLGARLAEALNTAVRAIPGGRHFTPEDHPRELAEAILDLPS